MGTPGKHQKQAEALKTFAQKAFTQRIKTSLSLQFHLPLPPTHAKGCPPMPGIQEELETQVQPLPHCPGFISAAVANTVTQSSTREGVAFRLPIPGCTPSFRKPRQERTQAASHTASTVKSRERSLHFPFLLACCSFKFLQSYVVPGRGHKMVTPTIAWVLPQQLTIKKDPPTDMSIGHPDLVNFSMKAFFPSEPRSGAS